MSRSKVLALLLWGGCAALLATGCTAGLTKSEQTCLECALRRRSSPEAHAAVKKLATLCREGDAGSCSALGIAFEEGHGVDASAHNAAVMYRRACNAGNQPGCVHLGNLYERGTLSAPDLDGAALLYQGACNAAVDEGCWNLARIRYGAGDARAAAKLLGTACSTGHAQSCESLGVMYQQGDGVVRDPQRAALLFAEACRGGSLDACQRL